MSRYVRACHWRRRRRGAAETQTQMQMWDVASLGSSTRCAQAYIPMMKV